MTGGYLATGTGRTTATPVLGPPRVETVPDSADPIDWAAQCIAHNYHQPVPRYLERHHIVPRAWQAAWRPADTSGGPVWHPETVLLCRSGHGNVHYWIERFMRHFTGSIDRAVALALEDQESVGRQEHAIARHALDLWVGFGGSLQSLAEQGLYGGLYGGNAAT